MKPEAASKLMWKLVKKNPNLGVAWYLMSAHAYYDLDQPFLPDADFDKLAGFMLERWDKIEHWHKHLITEDDLKAGTLLRRDFPTIIKDAAVHIITK